MRKDQEKHDFSRINDVIGGIAVIELIGILLYNERRKRNKTLEQLGHDANICPKTIDEIEIARTKPHWSGIEKLLRYYNKCLEVRLVDKQY